MKLMQIYCIHCIRWYTLVYIWRVKFFLGVLWCVCVWLDIVKIILYRL
jgi:hypothetical protein